MSMFIPATTLGHTPGAIIVPTTLGASSEAAYPFVALFADLLERPVRVIHVQDFAFGADPIAGLELGVRIAKRIENVGRAIAELPSPYLAVGPRDVTVQIRGGFPAREILDELKTDAAMAVVCLHGQVGERHFMLGSVAGKVIRASHVPVLAVRAPMEARRIQNILMPLDFSELASGAFDDVLHLAKKTGATLHLQHAMDIRMPPVIQADHDLSVFAPPLAEKALLEDAEKQLLRFAEAAAKAHVEVTTAVVQAVEGIAAALEREITDRDPDLVVMAAHGRNGFSRLLLGSVTEAAIQLSTRPVLVLKPSKSVLELESVAS